MVKKKLKLSDIELPQMSWLDPAARIFRYQDKLYRGIFPEQAASYLEIYHKLAKAKLFGKAVVETKIADIEVEGFGLVLEHHIIKPVTFAPEWSVSAFKDSALCTLDLMIALDRLNLELKDGHPWNTLIEDGRFYFIDLASIQPKAEANHGIKEFFSQYMYHLILGAKGMPEKMRYLLSDSSILLTFQDVAGFLDESEARELKELAEKANELSLKERRRYLKKLRKYVNGLDYHSDYSAWGEYRKGYDELKEKNIDFKDRTVLGILKKYKFDRLLDMAGNIGAYAVWTDKNKNVPSIVTDLDEVAIEVLYNKVKKERLPILPLLTDVMAPTVSNFLRQPPGPNQLKGAPIASPAERLKSDMVLAIAITHHLVFSQHYNFDQIVKELAPYTSKYLAIEYVDRGDIYVEDWVGQHQGVNFDWYTYANFKRSLQSHFKILEEIKSHDSPNHPRTIFMCELKRG